MSISIETLHTLFHYQAETGKLFWKPRCESLFEGKKKTAKELAASWNTRWADKEAFTAQNNSGYYVGQIFGKLYKAHRVIYALHHKAWPDGVIDHIDGDTTNNGINNLRETSVVSSNNTSGVSGVNRSTNGKRWRASIRVNKKSVHIGTFDEIEDAVAARKLYEKNIILQNATDQLTTP